MNMGDELSSQTNVNQPPIDNDFNQEEEPIMGANPFEGNQADEDEINKDPEKKVESLIGKACSIIRKHLNSNGINKHEDKKKEVLGMLTSAIIDGLNEEERNEIIDYLSDKIQGKGESTGDKENKKNNDNLNNNTDELSESFLKKCIQEITRPNLLNKKPEPINKLKKVKQSYKKSPFTAN